MGYVSIGDFGPFFDYPKDDDSDRLKHLSSRLSDQNAKAAVFIDQFRSNWCSLTLQERQETYTRTFELTPACAPYVSVHLFGEESFARSRFMTGLAQTYARFGLDTRGELPDHLSIVLRAYEWLEPEERKDLRDYCLAKALTAMQSALSRSHNLYLDLVTALTCHLDAVSAQEASHA